MDDIRTERLIITRFTQDMARAVHQNSLDDDNRRFVPDEVFETVEDAAKTVAFLMFRYDTEGGPFVCPVLLSDGSSAGYVQLAQAQDGWEIGYHIARQYTGRGYATEAVRAFLPAIARQKGLTEILGISLRENAASVRVMEKCGFQPVFAGRGPYQGQERDIVKMVWRNDPASSCTDISAGTVGRRAEEG